MMDISTFDNPSVMDGIVFNQQMFDQFMCGNLDASSGKEGKDKIERCPNFSEVEKTQFIELFEENKDILLNNGRKPNLAELKKEIWDKICLEMNATVSSQLPRTVNQLQTFWKNVSVRTKNKYKDLSPNEYDQLPPLTAKILTLADEASSAYNNSLNGVHGPERKSGGGAGRTGQGPGRPSGSSGRKSNKQHHIHQSDALSTSSSVGLGGGPIDFPWKFQPASNTPTNISIKCEDQLYMDVVKTPTFSCNINNNNINGLTNLKMTDYSRSSDSGGTTNNDDYDNNMNNGPVMADEHSNDLVTIAAQNGLSYENCDDSTPEPVPSEETFNDYLQTLSGKTATNAMNLNGHHLSQYAETYSSNQHLVQESDKINGAKTAFSNGSVNNFKSSSFNEKRANLQQQQAHPPPISNNNVKNNLLNNICTTNRKNNNNNKRKFSWEKFSNYCEKRAKIKEKAQHIELKNKALQMQIEANIAKKQKYDEQANYYRLKCLEIGALIQRGGFIGGKQLALFNKISQ